MFLNPLPAASYAESQGVNGPEGTLLERGRQAAEREMLMCLSHGLKETLAKWCCVPSLYPS